MSNGLLEALNSISTSLAVLAQQVRAEAIAGLGSRSKIAESVILAVFRRVLQMPEMIDVNADSANFPGIDLLDEATATGVQVTSETSASKILESIEAIVRNRVPISRLVVALTSSSVPQFRRKTREKWERAVGGAFSFNPDHDVIAFERLLSLIRTQSHEDILDIEAELSALVKGTHWRQLAPHLVQQVTRHLDDEQRLGRYIPDVHVPNSDHKGLVRCFAHPALFARRVSDWFHRKPISGLNDVLELAGLPAVELPEAQSLSTADSLEDLVPASRAVSTDLESAIHTLGSFAQASTKLPSGIAVDSTKTYRLQSVGPVIEMNANSAKYKLLDRIEELKCLSSSFLLVTGPAGQGKTNFLCDFARSFLLPHGVPCAYLTARQVGRVPHSDLGEVIRQLVFPAEVSNLDEGLRMLSPMCAAHDQPFVILIDGLNEHPDTRAFAGQLGHLLETLHQYPHVRVLMTCRSEFLERRFGSLINSGLQPLFHLSQPLGRDLNEDRFWELITRYFCFFKIRRSRVSRRVMYLLRKDLLLLRFFCEAYGGRGKDTSYEQPTITNVYRDDIFELYAREKLQTIETRIIEDRTQPYTVVHKPQTRLVLRLVAKQMLESGNFAHVPRTIVSRDLDSELTALLDEELILRQDLREPRPSVLMEPEEILSFTFDEMRDYMLAQYLLGIKNQDPAEFDNLTVRLQDTAAQSLEGLQRFLFYASRKPDSSSFYEQYRHHDWYLRVYDSEVFNIPPASLNAEDRHAAEEALSSGGTRAQHYVRELAKRWDVEAFPILNVEFLLNAIWASGVEFLYDVVYPALTVSTYEYRSLYEEFCEFVARRALNRLSAKNAQRYEPAFSLLLLLLPLKASATLDSPAMKVAAGLLKERPEYGLTLVKKALHQSGSKIRPYLWRLLSSTPSGQQIRGDVQDILTRDANDSSNETLGREAMRYLNSASPIGGIP